jgi:hypothetical protein
MGPYCNYCNNRCFIYLPDGAPQEAHEAYGVYAIIATCSGGQAFEERKVGWSYRRIMAAIEEKAAAE